LAIQSDGALSSVEDIGGLAQSVGMSGIAALSDCNSESHRRWHHHYSHQHGIAVAWRRALEGSLAGKPEEVVPYEILPLSSNPLLTRLRRD
jgi:hypothetical protein